MGMRNIAPFGLRIPVDLRNKLELSAKAYRRSLNSEILERLTDSLAQQKINGTAGDNAVKVAERTAAYLVPENDYEAKLIAEFRRLPPEKQLALIALLS